MILHQRRLKRARGEGWELRLGDSLQGLWPTCQHIITDTPYCEHVHAHHRSSSSGSKRRNVRISFEPFRHQDRVEVAARIARVAQRWSLVFTDLESVSDWVACLKSAGARHMRTGTWHKPDATPQITGDRPGQATESIVIAHAPTRSRWNGGGLPAFWSYPKRERGRFHQTQKPVVLLERLIELFTDPGDLILDPFAGSASTGVAAIRLGRRWVGWERDPQMFERAAHRLASTREQVRLPFHKTPRARQEALAL